MRKDVGRLSRIAGVWVRDWPSRPRLLPSPTCLHAGYNYTPWAASPHAWQGGWADRFHDFHEGHTIPKSQKKIPMWGQIRQHGRHLGRWPASSGRLAHADIGPVVEVEVRKVGQLQSWDDRLSQLQVLETRESIGRRLRCVVLPWHGGCFSVFSVFSKCRPPPRIGLKAEQLLLQLLRTSFRSRLAARLNVPMCLCQRQHASRTCCTHGSEGSDCSTSITVRNAHGSKATERAEARDLLLCPCSVPASHRTPRLVLGGLLTS